MVALIAHYEVADLARFISVFDEFEPTRREHGAIGHRLFGSREHPQKLVALIEFAGASDAEAFARSPARAAALDRAGVLTATAEIYEELSV